MHSRELNLLAFIVTAMVAIDALVTPVILLWANFLPESYTQVVTPSAGTVDGGTVV